MGLSKSGRSEDPHLYTGCHATPEHIWYYPPFRMAIPSFMANYPYITHPFAALITHFFSEELKKINLARLACLIHAASVRSEPGSNSPIIILRKHFETYYLKQIVPFLNRNGHRESFSFQRSNPSNRRAAEAGRLSLKRRSRYVIDIASSTAF